MKTFSCTTRVTQLGRAVRATERQKRVPGRDAEAMWSDAEAARQCERPSGSELSCVERPISTCTGLFAASSQLQQRKHCCGSEAAGGASAADVC